MAITKDQYSEFVRNLKKNPTTILEEISEKQLDAIHMAMGVSGESGELLDAIKKYAVYNKPIDRENLIEELGDLEFYMEGLRQAFEIDRQDVIDHNHAKLSKRYHKGTYSNEQAIERADKK